jgi:hypothetical protein
MRTCTHAHMYTHIRQQTCHQQRLLHGCHSQHLYEQKGRQLGGGVDKIKWSQYGYVSGVTCLLQKSLPLLRQSLVAKELSIEGIRPPPHHTVVFSLPNSATVVPQLQVS